MKSKLSEYSKKWWVWAIIIFLFLVIIFGNVNDQSNLNNNVNTNDYSNESSDEHEESEEPVELTESEKMTINIISLMDEKLAFDTGSYIKGDVPAGDYAFVKFSGSGSYYSEEDAAGNIIDNENFDSFGYVRVHEAGNLTTRGVLVSVNAFERLEVSGAKELYEILNEQTDYNQSGYYKVGTDIEPVTYVIESLGSSAYYAIMGGPIGDGEIIRNDNFNGRVQITISNGQYLTFSRAKITKQ